MICLILFDDKTDLNDSYSESPTNNILQQVFSSFEDLVKKQPTNKRPGVSKIKMKELERLEKAQIHQLYLNMQFAVSDLFDDGKKQSVPDEYDMIDKPLTVLSFYNDYLAKNLPVILRKDASKWLITEQIKLANEKHELDEFLMKKFSRKNINYEAKKRQKPDRPIWYTTLTHKYG